MPGASQATTTTALNTLFRSAVEGDTKETLYKGFESKSTALKCMSYANLMVSAQLETKLLLT